MLNYNFYLHYFLLYVSFLLVQNHKFIWKKKVLSLKIQSCKEDKYCNENNSNKCIEGLYQYNFYFYKKRLYPNETMKFEILVNNNYSKKKKKKKKSKYYIRSPEFPS